MQRAYTFSNDTLPVPEALFSRLIGAAPRDVATLVAALSETVRARLALFLNARAHLRHLGHAVADTCSETILMREGGQAGAFLSDRNTRDTNKHHSYVRVTRPVTLAEAASFATTGL